ncbi:MAG: tetratricopeptide repeat protein [Candidatus Sericytochromatia bacterium]|nr:tetratricopeptide repeat protein [Candidatus Tanganyikabacteria bacterium]
MGTLASSALRPRIGRMTHYELLGLRPEAGPEEVREAILAARASWERRRDASADPAAGERAGAALRRLAEAAADLGSPDRRRAYDEATLPQEVLRRIRAEAPQTPAGADDQAAERARLEAEEAIRADAERRREARRHQEEVEGAARSPAPEPPAEPPAPEPIAAAYRLPDRKPRGRTAGLPLIDWRAVGLLAFATFAGVSIALIPVALVTSRVSAPPEPNAAAGAAAHTPLPLAPERVGPASVPASQQATVPAIQGATDPAAAAEAASAALAAALSEPASDAAADAAPPLTRPSTVVVVVQQQAPPTPAPAAPDAQVSLQRAYQAYSAGRYHESLAIYDLVLAQWPDDPIARVARALSLLALGRPRDAEAECRKALAVQPDFPEAHFNLGVALHRQRRDDEAVQAFRRFVDLAPEDRAAPQARGFVARYNLARQRATMARPATR